MKYIAKVGSISCTLQKLGYNVLPFLAMSFKREFNWNYIYTYPILLLELLPRTLQKLGYNLLSFLPCLKIEGSRKLTRCGFGSYAQPTQVVYGSEVPYHSCCLPYRVGFWVGQLGYSGPFSFWGSFLAIFSHFSNGPSAKNISVMTENQTHKLKPSS